MCLYCDLSRSGGTGRALEAFKEACKLSNTLLFFSEPEATEIIEEFSNILYPKEECRGQGYLFFNYLALVAYQDNVYFDRINDNIRLQYIQWAIGETMKVLMRKQSEQE